MTNADAEARRDGTVAVVREKGARFQIERASIDKLVKFYPFDQINEAVRDSESRVTLKPILTFPK